IPVVTMELKTDNTQSVAHARKQYREDRVPSPSRRLLQPGRALVHFAVSNAEVYMTTALKGADTFFLPFNRGFNGGAGNPPIPGKSETSYLWEYVLACDLSPCLLRDFAGRDPDVPSKRGNAGGRFIFPSYNLLCAGE